MESRGSVADPLSIGIVQMRCGADREGNLKRAVGFMEDAAAEGAKLVCFQELFLSRYFCQTQSEETFELAEPFPGELSDLLSGHAKRLGIVLIVPYFEKRAPGVFHNSAFVIDADGTVLGNYRKMHIPDDPGFNEKYYFTPGDQGFAVWDTAVGRVSVLICWDQWFPEAARLAALGGAEFLFYPTAIGWLPSEEKSVAEAQFDAWRTVQRSHAIANGCFVAAVNRVGFEECEGREGIRFWGGSFVVGPDGVLLGELNREEERGLVVEIDRGAIEQSRVEWPFFRDRRVDAYAEIGRRYCGD